MLKIQFTSRYGNFYDKIHQMFRTKAFMELTIYVKTLVDASAEHDLFRNCRPGSMKVVDHDNTVFPVTSTHKRNRAGTVRYVDRNFKASFVV